MELAVNYQPQNWYCYALDAKSNPNFHSKMRALAKCVPNVLLTQREFTMDSAGHNMVNKGDWGCDCVMSSHYEY